MKWQSKLRNSFAVHHSPSISSLALSLHVVGVHARFPTFKGDDHNKRQRVFIRLSGEEAMEVDG
jgi:hypothetical protein